MSIPARNNRSNLELLTIYEVSKVLNSSLDLPRAMREVLRLLAYQLQMERSNICLLREDHSLRYVAGVRLLEDAAAPRRPDPCHAIAARVIKTGMPVVVPNLSEEPTLAEFSEEQDAGQNDPSCWIGVPIKTADRVAGVLVVDRQEQSPGDRQYSADVRILTMIASLIGQTVQLHRSVIQEREQLERERSNIDRPPPLPDWTVAGVVSASGAMREVLSQVHRVAPFKSTVLIRGESGTGKELIAKAIHDLSARANGPFVRVNCAALSETLLESELFGHERGAFTGANRDHKGRFELAAGGTLFLDEIGDISPSFQAKLLRVLQEQEFERVGGSRTLKTDVRVIGATNVNLEEAVGLGTFRADLYFRINVVTILLPPLRQRRDDIPVLAQHFVDQFGRENGLKVRIADEALTVLQGCPWPGNVRELENCIERAATQCRGNVIRGSDLACQVSLCNSTALVNYQQPARARSAAPSETSAPPTAAGKTRCAAGIPGGCSIDPPPDCGIPEPQNGDDECETSDALPYPPAADSDMADLPVTRDRLVAAMERSGWVQAKAARLLGLSARQLSYALRKHDIEIKRF
ncbi:MAG: nif-specific transcriptional activator NifA [Azospirillum sp.]|nr:nif-specific transcriptional activator NifA [Azospirillum sp.]